MKLLLIESCGPAGTLALAEDDRIRVATTLGERRASEEILPAIRAMLNEAGWSAADLAAIGAARGPGSFTGVRTGWSLAKGLAEASAVPLIGFSRLELLARTGGPTPLVHAALDAGRGQFYVARSERGRLDWQRLLLPADLDLTQGHWVACEPKVAETLGIELVPEPHAADSLPLLLDRLAAGANDILEDALYLRQTDAEIFAKPAAP